MIVLTKAEEQVMQVLWKLEKAFVKDILQEMPEPKPAYNTVSTIIRILEKKAVVGYEAFGKSHRYFPCIEKADYSRQSLASMMQNYFNGSARDMVSFFVKDENLSAKELEEILGIIEAQKQEKS